MYRRVEHYAHHVCRLGNAYNAWLETERGSQSAGTREHTWKTLIMLVKYQYRGNVNGLSVCRQVLIERLKHQAKITHHENLTGEPVVEEALWWQDWNHLLQQVTEELRYECDTNRYGGPWCSERVIATTFKTYLLAGFLTYRAPRRIGVSNDSSICLVWQNGRMPTLMTRILTSSRMSMVS